MNRKHGLSRTPIYRRWWSMVGRCTYPSHSSWEWYGAKGIKVCDRWRLSFEAFILDMGFPPSSKHSIERRDNNGNYEPGNCYWATPKEQQNNKSTTLWLTVDNTTRSASKWAELLHMPVELIQDRKSKGWSDERTLKQPKRSGDITCNGKTLTRFGWSRLTGIKASTIWWRLNHGWPVELALEFKHKD